MRRNYYWLKKVSELILILIIFISITSCSKKDGTNTGNPNNNGITTPANSLIANNLITEMCGSMKRCFSGMDWELCTQNLPLVWQILVELRVSGFISSYSDLIRVEQYQQIYISQSNGTQCLSSITNISCNSSEMIASYQDSQPNQFSNSYYLLRSNVSCAQIYSQTPFPQ